MIHVVTQSNILQDKLGKGNNVLEASFSKFTGQSNEDKTSLPDYNEVSVHARSTQGQMPNGKANEPTTDL